MNKTIEFVKKNPLSMKFPSLDRENSAIVVFSDASFGKMADGSSQGGHVILMVDRSSQ